MNSAELFRAIVEKLTFHSQLCHEESEVGLTDDDVFSEPLFCQLLNLVFGWNLANANVLYPNFPGIDLIDQKGQIVVQVSADGSPTKINDSLKKKGMENFSGYRFIFLCFHDHQFECSEPANPFHLRVSNDDFLDLRKLLNAIKSLDYQKLFQIDRILEQETNIVDTTNLPSDISALINNLVNDFKPIRSEIHFPKKFDPERKISFNELVSTGDIVHKRSKYTYFVDRELNALDSQGKFASDLLLTNIHSFYLETCKTENNPDKIFLHIIALIKKEVIGSANFDRDTKREEFDRAVEIFVVNAFLRCQIFIDPEGYNYDPAK